MIDSLGTMISLLYHLIAVDGIRLALRPIAPHGRTEDVVAAAARTVRYVTLKSLRETRR